MRMEDIFSKERTDEEEIIALFMKYKCETNENERMRLLKKIEQLKEKIANEGTVETN